ncbi:hypothetical protein [Paraburkholderia rhizosphaerae]|uniref:Uncharacterized protein n=1 Tax=Paraburkholderia rhizosphaerae TaxID=480658 RepID=A0A4V3HD93_9BURK|nr:hypothetical protein [Paraburkholderia rhizosphaerae]TDY40214.1 hypothetical protein BX592_12796 [Paraburkholderia rhizosphaerae]
MSRSLSIREHELLDFLLDVNRPLYGERVTLWKRQIATCRVREIDTPYFLAVCHDDEVEQSGCGAVTLGRELIALDQGVPVLIYVVLMKTPTHWIVDIFNVDRLDGEPLTAYPEAGNGLMIMEAGKRVGGADWRSVYGESDLPPPSKLE